MGEMSMQVSPAGLLAKARQDSAALAAALAAQPPGGSVHGARRRIKQLRSLLRLLRRAIGTEAYESANGALRRAADALAGSRRAEALLAAAARLEAADAQAGFWRGCAAAHQAEHAAGVDPAVAQAMAETALAEAVQALDQARCDAAQAADVSAAALACYGKARRLLRRGLRSGKAETLHEARKFVIHHLHHLQLLAPGRQRRCRRLEALRETLGDLNDLDELQQLAAAHTMSATDRQCMKRARRRLLRQAGQAATALFSPAPARVRKRLRHAARRVLPRPQLG